MQFLRAQEEKFPEKRGSSPAKTQTSSHQLGALLGVWKIVAVDKQKTDKQTNI